MGSKVSSKMAAPTVRVIQVRLLFGSHILKSHLTIGCTFGAIRPRAPLIKFPDRLGLPKPNAQEALKVLAVTHPQPSLGATPPAARPAIPFTRLPGSPDTLASIQLVPQRYRRRPMVVEEMDYIQRGGPE
ncbi:unnamed protein product [Merluccius merluccius]